MEDRQRTRAGIERLSILYDISRTALPSPARTGLKPSRESIRRHERFVRHLWLFNEQKGELTRAAVSGEPLPEGFPDVLKPMSAISARPSAERGPHHQRYRRHPGPRTGEDRREHGCAVACHCTALFRGTDSRYISPYSSATGPRGRKTMSACWSRSRTRPR